MIRLVSLAALAVAIASPAFAFDIKANVGVGQLVSQSQGNSLSGRDGAIAGGGHQDEASAATAGAQLQVKPSGVTVLTFSRTATLQHQPGRLRPLNAGLSFAGTQNASAGSWAGLAGALVLVRVGPGCVNTPVLLQRNTSIQRGFTVKKFTLLAASATVLQSRPATAWSRSGRQPRARAPAPGALAIAGGATTVGHAFDRPRHGRCRRRADRHRRCHMGHGPDHGRQQRHVI